MFFGNAVPPGVLAPLRDLTRCFWIALFLHPDHLHGQGGDVLRLDLEELFGGRLSLLQLAALQRAVTDGLSTVTEPALRCIHEIAVARQNELRPQG